MNLLQTAIAIFSLVASSPAVHGNQQNSVLSNNVTAKLKNGLKVGCVIGQYNFEIVDVFDNEQRVARFYGGFSCYNNSKITMAQHEVYYLSCHSSRYKFYRSGFDYDKNGVAHHWDGQMSGTLSWQDFSSPKTDELKISKSTLDEICLQVSELPKN